MKAEDIRELNMVGQRAALDTKTVASHDAALMSLAVSVFTEMAAQIAEMNDHLKHIAHPMMKVVNKESPWVEFITEDHRRVVFDKGEVVDVHEGIDPTDNRRLIVVISLRNQRYFRIIGDYGIICSILGVPTGRPE